MSFVYPLVAQKSFFGRLYDLSFLEHVCMKFGTRTDWWNCGLILFFSLDSLVHDEAWRWYGNPSIYKNWRYWSMIWNEWGLGRMKQIVDGYPHFFGAWIEQLPPS
jgi:hypothetical protein